MWAKVTQIVLMAVIFAALVTEESAARPEQTERPSMGGWREVNVTDPEVQEAAAKAVEHLEKARNSTKAYQLLEVTSAKFQVVRGKNFQLALKIGQTNCSRQGKVKVQDCSIVTVEQCVVTVWVWRNTAKVTNATCRKGNCEDGVKTRCPQMLISGGIEDIDVDSVYVIEAAAFATAEMSRRSNGRYLVQHKRIIQASSQVVAGIMYRMKLDVSVTATNNGRSRTTRCTVAVWDQPWRIPRYTLEEYKCIHLIL